MLGGINTFLSRFRSDENGASMVEFTLLAPILIALGFGAGEFGRAIHDYHAVNKGVRDAARFLARVPVTCPPGGGAGSIDDANDVTRAKNLAMTGYAGGGSSIISYWTDPSTVTVSVDCYDNSAGTFRKYSEIPRISVSVALPYQDMGFLSLLGVSGTITMQIGHQEIHIGE